MRLTAHIRIRMHFIIHTHGGRAIDRSMVHDHRALGDFDLRTNIGVSTHTDALAKLSALFNDRSRMNICSH